MAIDQHGGTKLPVEAGKQASQCAVIGLVKALDSPERIIDRDALVVNFLRVPDHSRHGSQAACHPHRTGVGERW
jgi:hypothetical protein